MASVQELRNLAIEDAKIIVNEMIEKLSPEHREQARRDVAGEEFHSYSVKIIAKSRKQKMLVQGVRLRPDKYHTEREVEGDIN